MFGDVGVRVIFGHAGEVDVIRGIIATIKIREIVVGKGLGDFDCTVGAKVEIDKGVAFFDFTDGGVFIVDDNESREVLVLNFRVNPAEDLDGFFGRFEIIVGFAVDHHVPTTGDDFPV